jgi:hypothetical protein
MIYGHPRMKKVYGKNMEKYWKIALFIGKFMKHYENPLDLWQKKIKYDFEDNGATTAFNNGFEVTM